MFQQPLNQLGRRLDIPYPARALVLEELSGDLHCIFQDLVAEGHDEQAARQRALQQLALDEASLADLEAIHNPAVRRAMRRLPPTTQERVEWLFAAVPLLAAASLMLREVPMLEFFREGGVNVYVVLLIGGLALLMQLHRLVSWFVLRNHSPRSMRRNTSTPLYLAAATFIMGVMGTALGYYVVFLKWAEGAIDLELVKIGLREPLSNVVVAGVLATLIVLLHGALQAGLRALRVPATSEEA